MKLGKSWQPENQQRKQPRRPANPPARITAKQKQRGKAQTKTHTKRFVLGHSDICHRVIYKNMKKLIVHCDNP